MAGSDRHNELEMAILVAEIQLAHNRYQQEEFKSSKCHSFITYPMTNLLDIISHKTGFLDILQREAAHL